MLTVNVDDSMPSIIEKMDIKEGLCGLVANKFLEKYQKPTIIFVDSKKEDVLKGSIRSKPGFNVVKAFEELKDFLLTSGGHAQAGGLSIKKDDFEKKSHFLSQKKAEIEKRKNDLQTLNSEITSEIKKLKKTNIQTLEEALVYLNGENNNGEIYTIQNKISNLKNQIITLNLSNLSELQKSIDSKIAEYKRLQNELTAMAVNSNFYDLYNALTKLSDEKLDYCPACKTPIEKTVSNPFTNAKLEIENFKKFEETKKSINSVLTELRNNILSFNNEIKVVIGKLV